MSIAEPVGRLVAARAVLLQALHHDPVQLAAEQLDAACAGSVLPCCGDAPATRRRACDSRVLGPRRLVLADHALHLVRARLASSVPASNGVVPVEQLVQQHAERVDVAARVDVERRSSPPARGLMYSRRADELAELGEQRLLGQLLARRLGDAEVDDLRAPARRRAASPGCSTA